ncbi:lysoplasmalogenase family protein [Microbacterium sp. NPDC008134]|uniref:lysoplasmalogenase family protein n=1 Tax=Microbacterium sp. NPDC008134 TaxID=3364183 RepID=UPI0036E756B1
MLRHPLPRALAWSFAPYVVVSIAHVVLLAVDSPAAGPTKILLMPLLAVPVIVSARRLASPAAIALIGAALLFSWLGDSTGAFFPSLPELPLMLGFFGLAHVAYIVLFIRHLSRRRMPWWALLYAAWWIVMLVTLGPHTDGLLLALAVYGLVLAGTAATSARSTTIIAIGGAFFLLSDTILAFRLFLPELVSPWGSPAVMLTYTLGQGLLVAGAIAALTRRSTS